MIKQYIKNIMPEKCWKLLSKTKLTFIQAFKKLMKALHYSIVSIILFPIKVLPIGLQAGVRERLNPVRNMDYKRVKLHMAVNSQWQNYRLRSAAKEPETVKWIEENLRETDVFYDIGANVGAYSLVAFAVSKGKSKVYAFEPSFSTYNELCKNVFLNRANESIVPLQLGLGASSGLVDFIYSELAAGAAQHAWAGANNRQKSAFSGTYFQTTLCFRLDDIVPLLQLQIPDIVKIDVDGPEFEVLLGAKETLLNPKVRSLLIELEDIHAEKLSGVLKTYGFIVDQIYRRGMTWCNYIFKK